MSKEIITIGDPNLADETIYCPTCGAQICYASYPPNYCPNCGSDVDVRREAADA